MPTTATFDSPGSVGWLDALRDHAIAKDLRHRPDLSRAAKDVWAFLYRAQQRLGRVYFAIRTIAQELACHPRTVQRCLRQLEDAALVLRYRRTSPKGDPTSNRYVVRWTPYKSEAAEKDISASADISQTSEPARPTADRTSHGSSDSNSMDIHPAPSKSGPPPTVCRDPQPPHEPESGEQQRMQPSTASAISKTGVFHKNNQPQPLLDTVAKQAPLEVVVLLTQLGIPEPIIDRWLRYFAREDVLQVAQWATAAPAGRIRSYVAWIGAALFQGWTDPPSWVLKEQAARESQVRVMEEAQQARNAAEESARRAAADRGAEQRQWDQLASRLDGKDGRLLQPIRDGIARERFRSLAPAIARAGSLADRQCWLEADRRWQVTDSILRGAGGHGLRVAVARALRGQLSTRDRVAALAEWRRAAVELAAETVAIDVTGHEEEQRIPVVPKDE